MIWPSTLVSTAMFTALHKNENKPADGWRISPSRFFVYVFLGSVAFYFLPGLLMPALSYFSVITWFAPRNVVIANLVRYPRNCRLHGLTSAVWYRIGPRLIPDDFRLGTDCVYWISPHYPILGRHEYLRWSACGHVDSSSLDVYVSHDVELS